MFLSKERQSAIYKEIFPYSYYTLEKYMNRLGNIQDAMKCIHDSTETQFIQSLKRAGAFINETTFDM